MATTLVTKLKSRRLNKNAPKAKTHKPKKGKGSYIRATKTLKSRVTYSLNDIMMQFLKRFLMID